MVKMNPIYEEAINWEFEECTFEEGLDKIVAYGEFSGYCPTYVERIPPCTNACPAGEDIRGYNNLVREGVWDAEDPYAAAFARLTQKNPFPAVMGRVCPAPCQGACNRQYRDETIGINSVEHAIGQYAIEKGLGFEKPEVASTGKHIAVVGGGVGGLSAAYQLTLRGHKVTIYERDPKLGGMLRYGILGYRVSREVIDAEVKRIIDLGVEVKHGVTIGKDVTLDELREKHDAVFLAVGAQRGRNIPIPGADAPNVTTAIDFLRDFEINGGIEAGGADKVKVGKNVVVIGDGDVAMDACRLALRLGSKATLLSGVSREEMNCSDFEYDEAIAEGTDMKMMTGTVEIQGGASGVTGIKVVEMVRKDKGEDGWNHAVPFFRYKTKEGTEAVIECDMVVAAIGQTTDMNGLESCTEGSPFLQVDHNYQIKGMDNVFGGGDAVQIHLLTTAIGHGRKAAESIDLFLKGEKLPSKPSRPDVVAYDKLKSDFFVEKPQPKRKVHHPANVVGDWKETLEALSNEVASDEAGRCMSCGMCFECNQCMLFCPQDAITKFKGNPEGEVMFTYYERCVGCHICSEVCPTGYIDMGMGI
uniref:NADPH-dependent glutamate synthase beta chain and related oxidoreductase n=1 Tax=Magnetococcus massalia (strain MO-1) TaxID=451514 RepID=A0A1S7LEH6_MAGMO|nr:NADPH-dependent glutamate synthase beta chain and related oxidoreductase [Candidatus Magnetococcus massalia]